MNQGFNAFIELGNRLNHFLNQDINSLNGNAADYRKIESVIYKAQTENQWFTKANVLRAFEGIIKLVEQKALIDFYRTYNTASLEKADFKRVGVIMAGNIPLVGFHDLMCVLLSGNRLVAKLASDDKVLMNFIVEELIAIEPLLKKEIKIVDRLSDIDAVIATGSNNSARYFEYYFGKYPHVIRANRNGVAVITGNETAEELKLLGEDIFTFFGLGCRNVSKLYVPAGYNFNLFFESINSFGLELLDHNKYLNNFDYHNALFLLEKIPFLTNNFLIIKEGAAIATPVAVVNYEYYIDDADLKSKLITVSNKIQCLVSKEDLRIEDFKTKSFYFGEAQKPAVCNFADGVDTMKFLTNLKKFM